MPTKVEWTLTNPELCTYKWDGYTAQRTLGDTIALWHDTKRIGVFENLADAAKWLARVIDDGRFDPRPWERDDA